MPNTCVWSQKDILTGQQLITILIGQRYETSTYPCRYYELVSSVFSLTNDVLGSTSHSLPNSYQNWVGLMQVCKYTIVV